MPYKSADERQYLGQIVSVLRDIERLNQRSLMGLCWSNVKSLFVSKKSHNHPSLTSFYNLIYLLTRYNIINNNNKLSANLVKQLKESKASNSEKITFLNKLLAKIIYQHDQERLKNEEYGLQYFHVIALKKAYTAWVRSIPQNIAGQQKLYIQRKDKNIPGLRKPTDDSFELEFSDAGYEVAAKKRKWLKLLLVSTGVAAVILTGLAQGMVPAVLAASISGGILISMFTIGIPSIIIDIVLYKTAVSHLVKDIWHDRLIKTHDGKFMFSSIPLLIVSLCGGITYGTMAYATSVQALNVMAAYILPAAVLGSISGFIVPVAAILAICTGISLTALFFSSTIDVVRSGPLKQFKQYMTDIFITPFRQPAHIIFKLSQVIINLGLFSFALVGAAYTNLLETSLLYSMSLGLFTLPAVALAMVLIAAPANMMFTFKIYNLLVEKIIELPKSIYEYVCNIKNMRSNVISLYNSIKSGILFSGLFLLNIINSVGSAKGLGDEIKEPTARTILNVAMVNPDKVSTNLTAMMAEFCDYIATNYEGIEETIRPEVIADKVVTINTQSL